jgi:hypothetical protein
VNAAALSLMLLVAAEHVSEVLLTGSLDAKAISIMIALLDVRFAGVPYSICQLTLGYLQAPLHGSREPW